MDNFEQTLKNPVWHALNEAHKKFVITLNGVRFYNPKICSFGAFEDPEKTSKALNEYAKLTNYFFLVSENTDPKFDEDFVVLERKIEGVQMVLKGALEDCNITEEIVPLTEKHVDKIYDLIWLVMPGYYKKRSFDMGSYFGIFIDNKLVAVTGQRIQTNSFIEVSGVVTHPDYTRRGLAKQLVAYTTKEILKTRKKAILHTTKGNGAIKLYEKLGYTLTREMNWWYFHKK
ncbi:FR47-like protein [Maribacter vaceletii]|uniref:FR47-like protein n=1 Tax=Maribacter vaceletii TaxID=1206816 RepID=A0A495E5N4_9FLAO|nr:GNAT family N-acetyltransferase [Maribacter vaceletii]RKR12230.1 FR47-like protein [Maribacter vaceletii]